MINWGEIDKSWKEFAKQNKVELDYNERNLFYTIKCKYRVILETEFAKSTFYGIIWKSTEGHNRYKTRVKSELYTKNSLDNFEIKSNVFKNFFSTKKLNNSQKDIDEKLKGLNGKYLSLEDNLLKIELNGILSKLSDFEKVNQLIKRFVI